MAVEAKTQTGTETSEMQIEYMNIIMRHKASCHADRRTDGHRLTQV